MPVERTLRGGQRLIAFDTIESTNAYAAQLALRGERGPLWIIAGEQTRGRGRAGRGWTSVPGNLYASRLASLAVPRGVVHQLSLLAGVALVDAVQDAAREAGVRIDGVRLKWPNDGLIGRAKFAGILPESLSSGVEPEVAVVIGIGVNLAGHPAGLDRAATSLAAHGLLTSPLAFLGHLAEALDHWLARWDGGAGFATVRAAWLDRAGPLDEPISIRLGAREAAGRFAGLDPDGALLLREADGDVVRFTYGDVALGPDTFAPEQDG